MGDIKKKMTNILVDVTKLEDMQKDLNDANIGDDVQEAKAISLVQNDEEFNTIKTNLKKAMTTGESNIASYAVFQRKSIEEDEIKATSINGIET
jgi:hypothetical protein